MTLQQMYDTANEEGAAVYPLWAIGRVENFYLVLVDTGAWYFRDTADHRIEEADARRLLEVFQIGYLP